MIPMGILASSYYSNALAPGPLAVTYLTATSDGTDGTSWTFSGLTLGAAAVNREIIVAVGATGGATLAIQSVTIAGVVARPLLLRYGTATGGFWVALVPAGTSGTVVVTSLSTLPHCHIALWRCTGGVFGANGGSVRATSPGNVTDVTVTGITDGATLAVGFLGNTGQNLTSWTGVTSEFAYTAGERNWYGARGSAVGSTLVRGTWDTSILEKVMIAAALVPGGYVTPTVRDHFDRSDGAMGSTEVGSLAWQAGVGGGTGWAISNKQAVWSGSTDGRMVVNTGLSTNYDYRFTMAEYGGRYPFVAVLRATSTSSDFLRLYRDQTPGTWVLDQASGSAPSGIGGSSFTDGTSLNLVAGDMIRVRITGTSGATVLKLYVNERLANTWTGTLAMEGGTYQGIGASGSIVTKFDHFSITPI